MTKKHSVPLTSYERKALFTRILTSALFDCACQIHATYVWERSSRILTIRPDREGSLQLQINLHFPNDPFFEGSAHPGELTLYYRAYFIESYIRLLEQALERTPADYFSGLVLLEAVTGLCGRQTFTGHDLQRRNPGVTLTDIHCTIRSLTKILLQFPEKDLSECRTYVHALLDYCSAPEVLYTRPSGPSYSSGVILGNLQKMLESHPEALRQALVLKGLQNGSFAALEKRCETHPDPLWSGLYIRLIACGHAPGPSACLYASEDFRAEVRQVKGSHEAFFRRYETHGNRLFADNVEAIKHLSRGIDCAFASIGPVDSGAVHYYR